MGLGYFLNLRSKKIMDDEDNYWVFRRYGRIIAGIRSLPCIKKTATS